MCAALNCNYTPSDDLANVLYELATKYIPNIIISIERNGAGLLLIYWYYVNNFINILLITSHSIYGNMCVSLG